MAYTLTTLFCLAAALLVAIIGRIDVSALFLLGAVIASVWRVGDGVLELLNQYRYRDYPPELRPKIRK